MPSLSFLRPNNSAVFDAARITKRKPRYSNLEEWDKTALNPVASANVNVGEGLTEFKDTSHRNDAVMWTEN